MFKSNPQKWQSVFRAGVAICLMETNAAFAFAEIPANILDLKGWKLTIPYDTDRPGKPDEVMQPELQTFVDPNCFFVCPDGTAVHFRAACDAPTTKTSSFPRSELREMQADGKDEIEWGTNDGNQHVIEAELAIIHLPEVKQHVVCAQIHDPKDDVIMIRLEKKKLFIERNDEDDVPLDSNYKLGDKFTLKIKTGEGRIKVWYNNEQKLDWKTSREKCYFKAGCYTQSNVSKGDKPEAYGEVAIYRLAVKHGKELE